MTTAALLTQHNAPLTLARIDMGPPLRGQVQVKILASGICGAQLQEIRGEKGNAPLPHLLGHEACGIVEAIGDGVSQVKPGDKVVCHWRKGDGLEGDFPTYKYHAPNHVIQFIRSGKVATFTQRALISENRVTRVEQSTPRELCALLGCGLSTALGTIENEAEMRFGESILVVGVGGLGANLILAAKIRGAGFISATDVADKAGLALAMGADDFTRPPSEIARLSAFEKWKMGFDVIIDTAGAGASMEETLPMLASGGRYIMVGQPKPNSDVIMANARHMFDGEGKTIKATQGGKFNPTKDIPRYIDLYRTGRLKLAGLITHRIALEEINAGLELVRQGEAGRVLIEM